MTRCDMKGIAEKPMHVLLTLSPKFSKPTASPPRTTVKWSHDKNVRSLAKETLGSIFTGSAMRLAAVRCNKGCVDMIEWMEWGGRSFRLGKQFCPRVGGEPRPKAWNERWKWKVCTNVRRSTGYHWLRQYPKLSPRSCDHSHVVCSLVGSAFTIMTDILFKQKGTWHKHSRSSFTTIQKLKKSREEHAHHWKDAKY